MIRGAELGPRCKPLLQTGGATMQTCGAKRLVANRWQQPVTTLQNPIRLRMGCQKRKSTRAGEGIRTLDIQLGKLSLYQLSYTRKQTSKSSNIGARHLPLAGPASPGIQSPEIQSPGKAKVGRRIMRRVAGRYSRVHLAVVNCHHDRTPNSS